MKRALKLKEYWLQRIVELLDIAYWKELYAAKEYKMLGSYALLGNTVL